jgi:prolyl oligopeptidase
MARAYSPYHRVTRGTPYPAVPIAGSEASPTVHSMHARKMAARLQAATTRDAADRPVLLGVEPGEAGPPPEAADLRALIDQRVFLRWQPGITWRGAPAGRQAARTPRWSAAASVGTPMAPGRAAPDG